MTTRRVFTNIVLVTALALILSLIPIPMVWATVVSSQQVDVEITVRVNQKGFFDHNDKIFNKRNLLQLPKGKMVRIVFVFDEAVTSLAYGDTHQVAIAGDDGTKESGKIWMFSQQTSIIFQTGEKGARYRAYCILDCIGMDNLNNLIISVV